MNTLEYKGVNLPYHEDLDDEGYSYHVGVNWNDREGVVFICEAGCHVEWRDGNQTWVDTNIVPEKIFGRTPSLTHDQMRRVLDILDATDFEGHTLSKEFVDRMYDEYRRQMGEDQDA